MLEACSMKSVVQRSAFSMKKYISGGSYSTIIIPYYTIIKMHLSAELST